MAPLIRIEADGLSEELDRFFLVSLLVGDVPEVFQRGHLAASPIQHPLILLLGLFQPSLCTEETGNHGGGCLGQSNLVQFFKSPSGLGEIVQGRVPVGLPRIIQQKGGVQSGESQLFGCRVVEQNVAVMGFRGFEIAILEIGVAQTVVRLNFHIGIVHFLSDGQGFMEVVQCLADGFFEFVGIESTLERPPLEQQFPAELVDLLELGIQQFGQQVNAFQFLSFESEQCGLRHGQLDPMAPREGFLEQQVDQSDGFLLVVQTRREVEIGLNPLLEVSVRVAQNLTEFGGRRVVLLLLTPCRLGSEGEEAHKAQTVKGMQSELHRRPTKIRREFTPRLSRDFSRLVPLEISSTFALPFGE